VALINIHHFFIDGCVWKISTPEVKKDLFRHLVKPPSLVKSSVQV
jgi:hypothetical protein